MNKFTTAYFGSSDFSADFLEKILTDQSINRLVTVKFVVTQPDRPVGRKQILTPTPVKEIAKKYRLPVFEVRSWKLGMEAGQEDRKKKLEKNPTSNFQLPNPLLFPSSIFQGLDLALVYAFSVIIPEPMLNEPKYGFWCLHPSLLPKYRGTSPMATALINGDKETGVTIIKMDDQIDHGPIIVQKKYQILPTDKRPDLEKKLTNLGSQLFVQSINRLDNIKFQNQDHSKASYTKKLTKQDGFIEFKNLKLKIENSPEVLYNLFRGLYPWPGIWTMIEPARLGRSKATEEPGRLNEKRLKITNMDYKDGKLIIKKVQLEGKKEVDFETFKKAYKIF